MPFLRSSWMSREIASPTPRDMETIIQRNTSVNTHTYTDTRTHTHNHTHTDTPSDTHTHTHTHTGRKGRKSTNITDFTALLFLAFVMDHS